MHARSRPHGLGRVRVFVRLQGSGSRHSKPRREKTRKARKAAALLGRDSAKGQQARAALADVAVDFERRLNTLCRAHGIAENEGRLWDPHWDAGQQRFYFHNRKSGQTVWSMEYEGNNVMAAADDVSCFAYWRNTERITICSCR